jgi:hypothetical protein
MASPPGVHVIVKEPAVPSGRGPEVPPASRLMVVAAPGVGNVMVMPPGVSFRNRTVEPWRTVAAGGWKTQPSAPEATPTTSWVGARLTVVVVSTVVVVATVGVVRSVVWTGTAVGAAVVAVEGGGVAVVTVGGAIVVVAGPVVVGGSAVLLVERATVTSGDVDGDAGPVTISTAPCFPPVNTPAMAAAPAARSRTSSAPARTRRRRRRRSTTGGLVGGSGGSAGAGAIGGGDGTIVADPASTTAGTGGHTVCGAGGTTGSVGTTGTTGGTVDTGATGEPPAEIGDDVSGAGGVMTTTPLPRRM